MAMRVSPKGAKGRASDLEVTKGRSKLAAIKAMNQIGKRFYFETQNGMHISVRARNGLLAVKALPSWVLL